MKIKVDKSTESFFQVYGSVINGKYVWFPKIYKKLDNYEYEEVDEKDLPEGIKKYIENQRNKK